MHPTEHLLNGAPAPRRHKRLLDIKTQVSHHPSKNREPRTENWEPTTALPFPHQRLSRLP